MKKTTPHSVVLPILAACALALGFAGQACSSAPKMPPASRDRQTHENTPVPQASQVPVDQTGAYGPPEPYGPAPGPAVPPQQPYGPEPVQLKPAVLVLGPGLARGFAHVGVLRALHAAKIPIGAIVGTETGALVGALYALSGSINEFEWWLLKFKPEVLLSRGDLITSLFRTTSDGKKLEQALAQTLAGKAIQEAKVPLRILLRKQGSSNSIALDSGPAAQAVRGAVAVPQAFTPGQWEGGPATAANRDLPYAVSEARKAGAGPIIVVDTLSRSPSPSADKKLTAEFAAAEKQAASEMKGADLVIRPDLSGIDYMDFQKETDAAYRGKNATLSQMREIRRLVGLPESPADSATKE